MSASKIYLDYNATTPMAPEVLEATCEALRDLWANPSSAHEAGVYYLVYNIPMCEPYILMHTVTCTLCCY